MLNDTHHIGTSPTAPEVSEIEDIHTDKSDGILEEFSKDSTLININSSTMEDDIGTLTWTGGAPSGTIVKRYSYGNGGQITDYVFYITATTGGLLTTAVDFPFPTGIPVPLQFASMPNNTTILTGTGAMGTTAKLSQPALTQLYKDGSGNLRISASVGLALTCTHVRGEITFCNAV